MKILLILFPFLLFAQDYEDYDYITEDPIDSYSTEYVDPVIIEEHLSEYSDRSLLEKYYDNDSYYEYYNRTFKDRYLYEGRYERLYIQRRQLPSNRISKIASPAERKIKRIIK